MPTQRGKAKPDINKALGKAVVMWSAEAIAVLVFGIQQDWLSGGMTLPELTGIPASRQATPKATPSVRTTTEEVSELDHLQQIQKVKLSKIWQKIILFPFPPQISRWFEKRKIINKWKSSFKTRVEVSSGRSQELWTQLSHSVFQDQI